MRSKEPKISPLSDYYVYSPSALAARLYLYPVSTGYFYYEPDYRISRSHFDSFLVMYIAKGTISITSGSQSFTAKAGQFALLDCYIPHSYGSPHPWEASWLHFDGILARNYYHEITSRYGNVLSPENAGKLTSLLEKICNNFRNTSPILESSISEDITNILNGFFVPAAAGQKHLISQNTIADSISYINDHFREDISLDSLAKKANLSLFHFSRVFMKETGFSPHQYLINTRISAAKYLLKSSEISIKDIAFSTGFNSESSFCYTFKKRENLTPSQFRQSIV